MPECTALCVSSCTAPRLPATLRSVNSPRALSLGRFDPPEDPAIRHLSEPRATPASARSSFARAIVLFGRPPHRHRPGSSRSRRRRRARRRPSGSDRRAASSTDRAPRRPARSSPPAPSAAGDAQFTYDIPVVGNNGESGTWSFSTIGERRWDGPRCRITGPAFMRGSTSPRASTQSSSAAARSNSTTNLVNAGPESLLHDARRTASTTPARRTSPSRQVTSTGSSCAGRTATPTTSSAAS